jgi:mono/diheme cytochrome c family protein
MPHDTRGLVVITLGCALFVGAVACTHPRPPVPTPAIADGADLFQRHCAECHGAGGRGDGRLSGVLPVLPADLTSIAARNGGTYPEDLIRDIIDGRRPILGHGGAGMPVWGDAFLEIGESYNRRVADEKIARLARYVASIQTTAAAKR